MPAISITRFESEILAHKRTRRCAPSTLRQVDYVFRGLRSAGVKKTSDITTARITAFVEANPRWSPATARSYLRCLRAMTRRAKKLGYLRVDPFDVDPISTWRRDDDEPGHAPRPKRRWSLTPGQVRQVLATADREAAAGDWQAGRLRAYLWTLLLLGMRPGELQTLEVWDIDLGNRVLSIRAKYLPVFGKPDRWWRPKTVGSGATIPIGDQLAAVLAEWIPRTGCKWLFPGVKRIGPWTSGGRGIRPLDQVKSLGERAGVPGLWQKSGRKSVGTHSRGAQISREDRRALFRHADEATGDHYDEGDVESLRPAVAKLERYLLGTGS